jgi:two-component system sensor histidine kinase KdpD
VVDVPENLPAVHADPSLLARAIANVVAHCLDATGPGRSVHIAASQVHGRVDLRVDDDAQLPPGGDRRPGGADLGLTVARGFVEAMHGHVVVDESADGHTTVVLQLPAETS